MTKGSNMTDEQIRSLWLSVYPQSEFAVPYEFARAIRAAPGAPAPATEAMRGLPDWLLSHASTLPAGLSSSIKTLRQWAAEVETARRWMAAPAPVASTERCPDCLGSEFLGFKRGVRCKTCNGTATVEGLPAPAAPTKEECENCQKITLNPDAKWCCYCGSRL